MQKCSLISLDKWGAVAKVIPIAFATFVVLSSDINNDKDFYYNAKSLQVIFSD